VVSVSQMLIAECTGAKNVPVRMYRSLHIPDICWMDLHQDIPKFDAEFTSPHS
jgi:hypothetical protein